MNLRAAFVILLALVSCEVMPPALEIPELQEASGIQKELAAPVLGLKVIDLPLGDVGSISIGWGNDGTQTKYDWKSWIAEGYTGVLFKGKGIDKTHVRCTGWGTTVGVTRHDGIVAFEDMTIHAGHNSAVSLGEQNTAKTVSPKFMGRFKRVRFVADPPKWIRVDGDPTQSHFDSRTKWLGFSYQCDIVASDCVFEGKEAREHDFYMHGFANKGAMFERCELKSAGAEGLKFRPDITETAYIPKTWIIIRGCKFFDWFQDWSDRGGAAIVAQNANSNMLIENCVFRPGKETERTKVKWNELSHCIEIASEGNGYTSESQGVLFGNENVWIRGCAISGKSVALSQNTVLRVAKNSGAMAARSVSIEGFGIYGPNTFVQLTDIQVGKTQVRGCNTKSIMAFLQQIGIDVSAESSVPTPSRTIPISEGLVR